MIVATAAIAALTSACQDRNRGISPDGAGLYFPSGIALDPRIPDDRAARWLFVLNGNSDLVYNAGSVVPIDLNAFFNEWMVDPMRCFGYDAEGAPLLDENGERVPPDAAACAPAPCPECAEAPGFKATEQRPDPPVVGDVGFTATDEIPCRRNAYKPQVIECEDAEFIRADAVVRMGNFGTSLRGWTREALGSERKVKGTLFAAVRGDPSVTYIDIADGLSSDPDDVPILDCGQGEDSGLYDPRRCAGVHKLTYLRDDEDSLRIASEPSNILATPGSPYVLVTHATRPALTLIDMDGQYDRADKSSKDGDPAIVQMRSLFEIAGTANGGWGLALRPCTPGAAPALTIGKDGDGEPVDCMRPLVYAGFRTALYVNRTFIAETEPVKDAIDVDWLDAVLAGLDAQILAVDQQLAGASGSEKAELTARRKQLSDLLRSYTDLRKEVLAGEYDQRCLIAKDIDDEKLVDDDLASPQTAGAFLCDPRLYGAGLFRAAAFDTGTASGGSLLGDMAFSRDGNRLFVVQTNPGGLAYIDTSIDAEGQTRDQAAGLIELCAQPTGMQVFYDGEYEYAAITCYKPQEVFIVDLGGVRVIANISVGTGPHPMAVDPARDLMYIANTLDKTVSVVDLSPRRSTRFIEIARIGRQVPYNR